MAAEPTRRRFGHCEGARMRASLDLDCELDEIGARQLRRHLDGCSECARWVTEMWALTGLLRTTPAEPAPCASIPADPDVLELACRRPASGHQRDRSRRVMPRALQ